jgi:hypothetical protein
MGSEREWGKGVRQVLVLHFYRASRGRGPRPDALAINGHGGGRWFYCLHEGKALIRRNGRGVKEGE